MLPPCFETDNKNEARRPALAPNNGACRRRRLQAAPAPCREAHLVHNWAPGAGRTRRAPRWGGREAGQMPHDPEQSCNDALQLGDGRTEDASQGLLFHSELLAWCVGFCHVPTKGDAVSKEHLQEEACGIVQFVYQTIDSLVETRQGKLCQHLGNSCLSYKYFKIIL